MARPEFSEPDLHDPAPAVSGSGDGSLGSEIPAILEKPQKPVEAARDKESQSADQRVRRAHRAAAHSADAVLQLLLAAAYEESLRLHQAGADPDRKPLRAGPQGYGVRRRKQPARHGRLAESAHLHRNRSAAAGPAAGDAGALLRPLFRLPRSAGRRGVRIRADVELACGHAPQRTDPDPENRRQRARSRRPGRLPGSASKRAVFHSTSSTGSTAATAN